MYMSVPIGSWGSYDPVITLKPLWGSPGTELSTWSIGSLCCIRAIQRTRLASRPLRSYTAIQRYTLYSYTSLYTIYNLCNTPLDIPRVGVLYCVGWLSSCSILLLYSTTQDRGSDSDRGGKS